MHIERSEQAGHATGENVDGLPPNGLAFSGRLEGTTLIDQEDDFAPSGYQKRSDPTAPLERRVGLPLATRLWVGTHTVDHRIAR